MTSSSTFKPTPKIDYDSLVLEDRVHGDIYTQPAIFDAEMERIFHRGWVYVGHESEIPARGDFQTRHIGRQPVIYIRGDDGEVRVLMNRCTHRAAIVCPHEQGNAKRFTCPYHGWSFHNSGALLATPHGERYNDDFRKQDFGLRAAPRVASYRGLTFASLAENGISLDEHLGPLAKAEIDIAFDVSPLGKIEVSGGTHKYGYDGNWKLQVENSADGYHLGYLHRSFLQIQAERFKSKTPDFSDLSPFRLKSLGNGHVCWQAEMAARRYAPGVTLSPTQQTYADAIIAAHGEDYGRQLLHRSGPHVVIFPNLVFIQSHIRIIRPISVDRTEVFLYPYRLEGVDDEINTGRFMYHQSFYGPAGGGASDDLEVFERITKGLRATVDPWIHIQRGLGREQYEEDGSVTGQFTDELNNRAILHHWRRLMNAEDLAVTPLRTAIA